MTQAGSRKTPPAAGAETKASVNIMRAALPADRSSVTLEMTPESGASGQIKLTQHGLSLLIKTLGRVHAAMVEGKPIPPFEGQSIEAIVDPRWQVGPGLMGEATAFTFHHPGFGPLGFLVPLEQVETIVEALSKQIEAAAATKQGAKN